MATHRVPEPAAPPKRRWLLFLTLALSLALAVGSFIVIVALELQVERALKRDHDALSLNKVLFTRDVVVMFEEFERAAGVNIEVDWQSLSEVGLFPHDENLVTSCQYVLVQRQRPGTTEDTLNALTEALRTLSLSDITWYIRGRTVMIERKRSDWDATEAARRMYHSIHDWWATK